MSDTQWCVQLFMALFLLIIMSLAGCSFERTINRVECENYETFKADFKRKTLMASCEKLGHN